MGHAHFLIPEAQWQSDYSQIPPSKLDLFYKRLLGSPTLKVLYHLAEQLKMVDDRKQVLGDPYLQRRYSTRNILGFNDGSSSLEILFQKNPEAFNTVNELDGHYFYGGFNISGSKDGCFSYIHRGTVHHYDLSLKDLEPTPGTYAD